ncbi:MAG TPA: hypothetical protein VGV90_16820 [Solirubrobacteraceae bacterium]|nr:hypothetical protein [Solirubrobacteraceae bacterium]
MHGRTTGSHHPHAAEFRQLGQGRWNWLLALLAGLSVAAPAQASFPGANGKIAFSSTRDGNYALRPGAELVAGRDEDRL